MSWIPRSLVHKLLFLTALWSLSAGQAPGRPTVCPPPGHPPPGKGWNVLPGSPQSEVTGPPPLICQYFPSVGSKRLQTAHVVLSVWRIWGSKALKYLRKSWKMPILAMELQAVWADGAPKAAGLCRRIRCGASGCVPCTAQGNTAQGNTTLQHRAGQHNIIQRNSAQGQATQYNTTQLSTGQHNTAQHNTTQGNSAQGNTTQHNTTQHNTTQGNTACQHRAGQHSMAQGSVAQAHCAQNQLRGPGGPRMSPSPLLPGPGLVLQGASGRGRVWGLFGQGWPTAPGGGVEEGGAPSAGCLPGWGPGWGMLGAFLAGPRLGEPRAGETPRPELLPAAGSRGHFSPQPVSLPSRSRKQPTLQKGDCGPGGDEGPGGAGL